MARSAPGRRPHPYTRMLRGETGSFVVAFTNRKRRRLGPADDAHHAGKLRGQPVQKDPSALAQFLGRGYDGPDAADIDEYQARDIQVYITLCRSDCRERLRDGVRVGRVDLAGKTQAGG